MLQFVRRSLLSQLLSVYLLFVVIVLAGGLGINLEVEQRLQNDVQGSDQALAQEIALSTSIQLGDDEIALTRLSTILGNAETPDAITRALMAFRAARSDVDYVYWLDSVGILRDAQPADKIVLGGQFSPPDVVRRALLASSPVFEVGAAVEPTFTPGIIIAQPVFAAHGTLVGIVAASLSLVELSEPLGQIVHAQLLEGRHLIISTIDNNGVLIGTPDHARFLQTVLDELPGASEALHGQMVSRLATGPDRQNWLFSAAPVPAAGWAVIVQRPASEALAVVEQFHLWLLATALLFAIGGLLFWLLLLRRVIRPLHTLAIQHQALPISEHAISDDALKLANRQDEMGNLAGSLLRLERDGLEKLGKLHTLLETSNVVVGSLDPHAVVSKIIREVRRLVNVQAAAVLLPDEQGILRVLASDGHSTHYAYELSLAPDNIASSAVLALRSGKPVQKLLDPDQLPPSLSYAEGFRSVLAVPIISRHAGSVVLLVHCTQPHLFNQDEVDLLLTFANYATLAWEHAVLYERSDERLQEIARENENLYQQASEEKQRLEAIMGSMRDGLVLTGVDGMVLYANLGALALAGLHGESLEHHPINILFAALQTAALDSEACARTLAKVGSTEVANLDIELRRDGKRRAIHIRSFDVNDESGLTIGRGLLLRDVTRERELDEFKTTLLAAVGHELRTPLAAIKGHASTLLQQDVIWSPADQSHFLQTISGEADRLAQLVSNLLDLSRKEAGLLLLNREPARMRDLLIRTLERLGPSASRVVSDIPDDLPLINIDSARIEIVLYNLITNAQAYGGSE
ncbi:MAG TPA: histidine kinase dimerization/phospho-acceptor domain-containing protein, partial [Ktedonobacteraceae bacterium]|nr:histidine kinase dimerization/phospho-acceptor domain-containing protein [Ktedonobacteraceae bacterium]